MLIRDWLLGVICGSTAAYLFVVILGVVLPSWPFNLFFTPMAAAGLLLQWPLWRDALISGRLHSAIASGALVVLVLWGIYFLASPVELLSYFSLLLALLAFGSTLVYCCYRHGASGYRRALWPFLLGVTLSTYLPGVLIVFMLAFGCDLLGEALCPYPGADIAQPLASVFGLAVYLWLWSRRR